MKIKLFLPVIGFLLSLNVCAQKVWFDADFSTKEWLEAFKKELGADIRKTADNSIDLGKGGSVTEIDGFVFNGGLFRLEEFTSICDRPFKYNVRLRNNNESFIELPKVKNAGKIYVYVRNPHPTAASSLELQVKGKKGWNKAAPLVKWSVPGHTNYGDGANDYLLTYNIDSDEPIKLRLYRDEGKFFHVFRVVLEQKD